MIQLQHNRKNDPSDQIIDLTSLIDVLFTLLIFFILAMGTTQITTVVRLPTAEHYQNNADKVVKPLIVEIGHQELYWKVENHTFKSFSQFQKTFLADFSRNKNRPILLGLERSLPVERLTELLNFLSVNRFSNIQIVSEWKKK